MGLTLETREKHTETVSSAFAGSLNWYARKKMAWAQEQFCNRRQLEVGGASMPGPQLTPPPCPHCQVLCQEEDLSIDYQYWGPRKQTLHRAQGEAHALRQPQAREVEAQHPEEPADFPEATAATHHFAKAEEVAKEAPQVTPAPLRTPTAPGSTGAGAGGSPQLSRPSISASLAYVGREGMGTTDS